MVTQAKCLQIAAGPLHAWLRLLLSYHSPALVQHLDRVLPGWEQPVSAAQVSDILSATLL